MKARKLIMAAVSLVASAVLAVSAGAYITKVSSPGVYLESSQGEWGLVFPADINAPVEGMSKIEVVVSIAGGQEKYDKEKADGFYDDGKETAFADFEGHIGIGATIEGTDNQYWHSFDYSGLAEKSGGKTQAAVQSLGGGKYKLTGNFGSIKVHPSPASDVQLRFKDWGNKSPNYSLTVEEFSVYGPDGSVVIHADASGNVKMSSGAAQTTAATTTTVTTTTTEATTTTTTEETTTAETSAEETGETETSAEETSETTTTAAATTTTKIKETTTAADTEAQTSEAQASDTTQSTTKSVKKTTNNGFNERDTVLLIVGIAAGAIILAVIIYLVLMMLKKKK